MSMELQKQIEKLHESFLSIHEDDHESKVNNVKSRIYLMKQLVGYDAPKKDIVPTFAQKHEPKESVKKDTRAEMSELRKKLVPKAKSLPFDEKDMASKNADEELKRALNKAFESI